MPRSPIAGFAAVLFAAVALCRDARLDALLEQQRMDPNNATLCDRIGIAYTQSGDLPNAEVYFRRGLQLKPGMLSARKNLGTVLWFENRHSESEREFRKAALAAPRDPVVNLYLGLASYDRKDFTTAASHLSLAGDLASDNPEVFPILMETYLEGGRAGEAVSLLQSRIALHNNDPKLWLWLGDAYDRVRRPDDSYRAFSKAIDADPSAEQGYLALAVFSIAHGNRSYAREVLERGLARRPGSAALRLQTGILWALDGVSEKAEENFRAAAGLSPQWSLPLLALGLTQIEAGKLAEAAASFERAATLDQTDFRAHYLYATALMRMGVLNNATRRPDLESALSRAIARNPKHASSRVSLARLYLAEGRTAEARKQLEAAVQGSPNDAAALYQLALLRRREGNDEQAGILFQRFESAKKRSAEGENELIQILKTVH